MSILDKIIHSKTAEVSHRKIAMPIALLEQLPNYHRKTVSLAQKIRESNSGIIAEHKRRSPSRPIINTSLQLPEVISAYTNAGVSGISVLTDMHFFGGSMDDLLWARSVTQLPLLRKDFIIDEYQIHEAKAFGADVILLIAAALTPEKVNSLTSLAQSLGLEVLLEVHNREELLSNENSTVDLLGVNNRNLKTFEVSLDESIKLAELIPEHLVAISESGIETASEIELLKKYGYQGFLIGTHFMKNDRPGEKANSLIKSLGNEN